MFGQIFTLLDQGAVDQALAQTVQSLKATQQHCLDRGSWKNAWPLVGLPDPLDKGRWGGTEVKLENILSYNKAIEELTWKAKAEDSADLGKH